MCVEGRCEPRPRTCPEIPCEMGLICVNAECVPRCRPLACDVHCDNGFAEDADGCLICQCAEAPPPRDCPEVPCDPGQDCVDGRCVDGPPPTCPEIDCEEGLICVDNECVGRCPPFACELHCDTFARDENDCLVCECAED